MVQGSARWLTVCMNTTQMNYSYGVTIDAFCRDQPGSGNCKVEKRWATTIPTVGFSPLPGLIDATLHYYTPPTQPINQHSSSSSSSNSDGGIPGRRRPADPAHPRLPCLHVPSPLGPAPPGALASEVVLVCYLFSGVTCFDEIQMEVRVCCAPRPTYGHDGSMDTKVRSAATALIKDNKSKKQSNTHSICFQGQFLCNLAFHPNV